MYVIRSDDELETFTTGELAVKEHINPSPAAEMHRN